MHIDNVIFLILSKNAYTKFSEGPVSPSTTAAALMVNSVVAVPVSDTINIDCFGRCKEGNKEPPILFYKVFNFLQIGIAIFYSKLIYRLQLIRIFLNSPDFNRA